MRFLISIGSFILGFILIWKTYALSRILGTIPWAEQKLGGGGTYVLLKILGVCFIVFSLIYIFGIVDIAIYPFGFLFGSP